MHMPEAVWSGTFVVFGVVMHCYVLDDGRRVIDAEDVAKLFDETNDAPCSPRESEGLEQFVKWQMGKTP